MGNVFRYYNYKALAHILALQIILKKISTVFFLVYSHYFRGCQSNPKGEGGGGGIDEVVVMERSFSSWEI